MTGGYVGTDMDVQIKENMSQYQAERLKELMKQRRQLREKILCGDNCTMEKWSFKTGIHLNQNCPIDCAAMELNGQMKLKTSIHALELYNSFPEIKDLAANKAELVQVDLKIKYTEKEGF